jgi:hypothetical protein
MEKPVIADVPLTCYETEILSAASITPAPIPANVDGVILEG